ncbi:DgyrCDS11444 [Dimorphilus gyrociliatus]|uniref:Coiled-coil alpha-helical rod protein 1 n=1 Tax=Dimorphilus gyrociliatus TaxID=2664684 RepID=A0A7I8W7Y3_9ANNE|nr:DgyrCDS11444 [Dimorphilus gyrociliatus]
MAAKLSTPDDYSQEKPLLLPPTHFVVRQEEKLENNESTEREKEVQELQINLQKRYDDALLEMKELKEQIHKFTEKKRDIVESISPMQQLMSPLFHTNAVQNLHEIIDTQKKEINILSKELETSKITYEKELMKKETEFSIRERNFQEEIRILKSHLVELKEDKKVSITNLEEKLKDEENKYISTINHLKEKLNDKVNTLEDSLSKINNEKDSLENDLQRLKKETEIREKELELVVSSQKSELNKLKSYLSEAELESSDRTNQRIIKTLQAKIESLEKEGELLQTTAANTKTRFDCQNQILCTQENELMKSIQKSEQRENLLTKWRQEVWKLLVKTKQKEAIYNKEKFELKNKITILNEKCESNENQINILKHTIDDKNAEISICKSEYENVKRELISVQRITVDIDDQYQNACKCLGNFLFVKSLSGEIKRHEDFCSDLSLKILSFDRRISFAGNRIQFIQDQLTNRQYQQQQQYKDIEKEELRCELNDIKVELERVKSERANLIKQVRNDSEHIDDKIRKNEKIYTDEINQLKNRIGELHAENLAIEEKKNYLEKNLEKIQENVTELENCLDAERKNLVENTEKAKQELRIEYSDQINDLQWKLTESRKEQTRAVLNIRQLERSLERCKQDLEMEKHNVIEENDKIRKHLQSSEREKNILIGNINDSLFKDYSSLRKKPASFYENEENKNMDNLLEELEELSSETLRDSNDVE